MRPGSRWRRRRAGSSTTATARRAWRNEYARTGAWSALSPARTSAEITLDAATGQRRCSPRDHGGDMSNPNYERLSGQDNSFLVLETPNLHMHVASTQIFELGPSLPRAAVSTTSRSSASPSRSSTASRAIARSSRGFRSRTPGPVWVDDAHFNIDYHVRHTSLPQPGSEEQLKQLAARIMAQQLDRSASALGDVGRRGARRRIGSRSSARSTTA